MILHFPCLERMDQSDAWNESNHTRPTQSRLYVFGAGLTFDEMCEFQVDQYTRRELARDADIPWVDQTYPGIRDEVPA